MNSKRITPFFVLALFAFGFLIGGSTAHAAVSGGTVACHATSDCYRNASSPAYDVSFSTNDASTATVINVTFPSGYIASGFAPSVSSPDNTINAINLNGTNVTGVSTNATGNMLNFHLSSPTNLSTGTVSFKITGIAVANPSTLGVTGNFTITTDAAGETAQSNVAGVTILGTAVPTLTSPTSTTYLSNASMPISFTLPDAPLVGSVSLAFTPTVGSTTTMTLQSVSSGANTFSLPLAGGIGGVSKVATTNHDSIPPGTYSVTLAYQNTLSYPSASVTVSNVVIALPTYAVTYTAGTGGAISGNASQTISLGSDASAVTAVPNNGYRFVNWSDASVSNPRTDTNVTGDTAVTANFALILRAPHSVAVVSPTPLDKSKPLDFTINNGASTTNSPTVHIRFNADPSTVTGYAISLEPTFATVGIEPYTSGLERSFQLPTTPGRTTVYVEYFSSTGSRSSVISHTISYNPNKSLLTTKSAVEQFQIKYGIVKVGAPGYGKLGPKTLAKMREVYGQ